MGNDVINRQSRNYKRGMILGLTMAEIMLLLVFCLLLAVGSITRARDQELLQARSQLKQAERKLASLSSLTEGQRQERTVYDEMNRQAALKNVSLEEFWRELIESEEIVGSLEANGLTHSEIAAHAKELSQAIKLMEKAAEKSNVSGKSQDKPPIIVLNEADGFFFDSGRADIKPEFARNLKQKIIPKIVETMNNYDVDIVEVVGHTDAQPFRHNDSNLDQVFPNIIRGAQQIGDARSADNAGLGLMRAVAVVRALLQDEDTKTYRMLPYSAGQLIDRDEKLSIDGTSGSVDVRRRIEIRLRKSSGVASLSK